MKRVYWVATFLMFSILTSCGPAQASLLETATAAPPVASTVTVPPASPTTPPSTPTTVPVLPTNAPMQEPTAAATGVPSTPLPTFVPDSTATADGAVRTDLYGKLLFVRGKDVWVYTPRDGVVRLLLQDARDARWSPDGSEIAFVRDDGVYLANADTGDEQLVHAEDNAHAPVWAPDGAKIAFEIGTAANDASTREVWVYDLAPAEARKVSDGADPAWAPDSERIAYVTVTGSEGRRRTELRLVDWRGQNASTIVRDLADNTPAIGIPDNEVEPTELDHVMQNPFWNATGESVYVASYVNYQVLVGFSIWERADASNGGSTFVGELPEVIAATSAPNRQAVLFSVSSARGDSWFVARGVETEDTAWSWAETSNGALADAPAWSPDSAAVAYYYCELEAPEQCDLRVRDRDGEAVVIDDVFGSTQPDRSQPLMLDWSKDE